MRKEKKTERVAFGANAKTKNKKNKETEENDALSALSACLCARVSDLFFSTARVALVSTDGFARVK